MEQKTEPLSGLLVWPSGHLCFYYIVPSYDVKQNKNFCNLS